MTEPLTPESAIDRILAYVDAPWKIVSVAVLVLVAILAITLWEKRAEIADSVLHRTVIPRLEPSRFNEVVEPLMKETHADVGLLLAVQLNNNITRIVAGLNRDNPHWVPSSEPRPIFIGNDPHVVVQLISGATECSDTQANGPSRTGREMFALGVRRACLVSVPPVVDVLVGALGIGWKTPPDALLEAASKAELRRAANKLATW